VDPTAADWPRWVELATSERVLPQLYEVALTAPDLTDDARAEATTIQLDVASTMVRLEHSLLEVADILDGGSVPHAVLKGMATAHLDHPDPSRRQFGDIDLLVAPGDLPHARALLEAEGWSQAYRLPRHHEVFTHAITFSAGGLAELDLHQHVAHRALGLMVPTHELLADRAPFVIAGRTVWALCRPDRLIHGAIHAAVSRGAYQRLSSATDVLRLVELTADEAGPIVDRAERWGVRSIVEQAVRTAHATADVPIPAPWQQAMEAPRRRRSRLVDAAYLSPARRPVLEELAYLRLLPGWGARWRYLSGYFVIEDRAAGDRQRVGLRERARYLWSRLTQRSG
jgi:hypothetical protein